MRVDRNIGLSQKDISSIKKGKYKISKYPKAKNEECKSVSFVAVTSFILPLF